jgi:Uma2 family endonuclease
MTAARKLATFDDFLAVPQDARAEWIDGEIVYKAQPGGEHASTEGAFLSQLRSVFHKKTKSSGEGGWWLLPEVSIHYRRTERVLTADIAGWKRSETPECPKGYPVVKIPNFVCEISHTTLKKDTTIVLNTLQADEVAHYWIANVEAKCLQVFELHAGKYALVQSLFHNDGWQRIQPFDAVQLHMGMLFGEDHPDDV